MEMSARKPLLPRRVLDLPIDALRPNPNQPRIEFDEASLRSLSDSIRRYGILQPLTESQLHPEWHAGLRLRPRGRW